ncbi:MULTISPECIES: DUF6223 family protein [Amycolatopsis]|uniref:DUF6223 family protein n=1 Tax=Amycolatopsis thermalba TaxID=944492 RepID=A0ABY4NX85_9PSEU|nr:MULTISPECIES: DUF6223 family protein [Amycolatopsis]OXM72399.1 hypothetical protein CF166_15110 [Amycolatopsis sp. KNN50.9b]UQS24613.1 DUF6223 family protein [Amycolatopsis thermalba]
MFGYTLAQAADPGTLTSGRLVGAVAALVAVAGVVLGALAVARHRRRGSTAALATGVAGMAGGGLVVALAEGGPGTGYGIVGGFAAVAIGLIAAVLGGLGLARSRA